MSKKAFTILELVVAITIISILSALIIPRVIQYVNISKDNVLLYNLSTIRKQLAKYAKEHDGYYPRCLYELVDKGYLNSLPVNPYTELADWEIGIHHEDTANPNVNTAWVKVGGNYMTAECVLPLTTYTSAQLGILGKSASDFRWDKNGISNVRIGGGASVPHYHDTSFDPLSKDGTNSANPSSVNVYPDYSNTGSYAFGAP